MIYCFVNNGAAINRLAWITPNEISLSGSSSMSTDGVFTARRISIDTNPNTLNSSLTFTADTSFDERVIECQNNLAPLSKDNCTLLVYSKLY